MDNGALRPQLLDDRLAHWAKHTPDAEAISYLDRTWTWAQWNDRVRRLAGALTEIGIRRGDIVAFLDKNHPACVELTFAAGSLGAATAVVNFRLAPDEIDFVLNDCRARILIVGAELRPAIGAIADRLSHVERIVTVTPDGDDTDEYERLLAASAPVGQNPEASTDDTVLVMYSSGTTGRPKGVELRHRNLIAHGRNSHDGWVFEPGDKSMVAMPLFHVGGSSWIQVGIHDGVPTVLTRDADGASLADAIRKGANRTFLVPAVLATVLSMGQDAIDLFGRLKLFNYGAAPMPLPLLREAVKAWPDTDFRQVYGLTEVCGVITALMPDEHRNLDNPERLISAGKPTPEVEVRVVNPDTGQDVPVGTQGELWFRTPQLMKGYLNRPEATAEAITPDGWFRSGDIGRVDEDGYVYVEDRLKDMIISGGENIYSIEVERTLAEHPAVTEVAVFGVPDEKWGEAVKAAVALAEPVDPGELIDWCRQRLAHYKCPKTVDVLDALPRNPTGKILKRDLRKPYWEGRDRATV